MSDCWASTSLSFKNRAQAKNTKKRRPCTAADHASDLEGQEDGEADNDMRATPCADWPEHASTEDKLDKIYEFLSKC